MASWVFFQRREKIEALGIRLMVSRTEIDSYFGNTTYNGEETTFRGNVIMMTRWSRYSDHAFAFGAHYLYDEYNESLSDSAFSRAESVPGYIWNTPIHARA